MKPLGAAVLGALVLVGPSGAQTPGRSGWQPPPLDDAPVPAREEIAEAVAAVDALPASSSGEARGEAWGTVGAVLVRHGFGVEAAEPLERASNLDPEDPRWPYLRGVVAAEGGDLDEAAVRFDRAASLAPTVAAPWLRLGDAELRRGGLEEARRAFEVASGVEGGRWAGRFGLARVAFESGEPERAIELLEDVVEAHPEAGTAHQLLGLARRETGDLDAARESLARAGPEPVPYPDPWIASLVGEGVAADLAAAARAEGRGDLEAAVRAYRRVVEAAPEVATYRQQLAKALAGLGAFDAALGELQVALDLDPEDPLTHHRLGLVREAAGRSDDAIRAYRRALELDPENRPARYRLAEALAGRGELEEAVSHYDVVLAADPQVLAARLGRGRALARLGRTEAARVDLEAVLEIDPKRVAVLVDLVALDLAAGEADRAVERLESGLALVDDPGTRGVLSLHLGNARQRAGELDGALEAYRTASEAVPGLRDAHYNLGALLGRLGRWDEASAAFRRAVELPGEDPDAIRALGLALARSGRCEEGVTVLEGAAREEDLGSRHVLARLLATCPAGGSKAAVRALDLAVEVVRAEPSPAHYETLALAMAAAGRREEAVELQRRLVEGAVEQGAPGPVVERLEANLARFEAGEPGTL